MDKALVFVGKPLLKWHYGNSFFVCVENDDATENDINLSSENWRHKVVENFIHIQVFLFVIDIKKK